MIQRIQTIYLAVAMILLSIVATGSEVFRFVGDTIFFKFNAFGIERFLVSNPNSKSELVQSYPLYISLILLVMFLFVTLMGYKNLKRQLKLVRTAFYIYLLLVITLIIFSSVGLSNFTNEPLKRELGLGFFLFIAGLPFVFLANLSIKRDKKLIDSLNRLR
jgi:amino acid transporter